MPCARPWTADPSSSPSPHRWEGMQPVAPRQIVQEARARGLLPDLSGLVLIRADLSGLDLSECDLRGLDLSECDLREAKLSGAHLEGAHLHGADLTHAELLDAFLKGADLSDCTAHRAALGHAVLDGANLFGADLSGASMAVASLRGADLRGSILKESRIRDADLTDALFDRADMQEVDLGRSLVAGASFVNADLRRARLRALRRYDEANWVGADIRDIDFTGGHLLHRFIRDQNYLFEFRTQSRWHGLLYWLWWATSDCGRSASRWFALNALVALVFAGLYLLVEVDFGPHRTAFSPIYFSFVTLTTLGYGDVVPVSGVAQALATVEVVMGYMGLGGMLSILATKMARRSD